MKRRRCWNVGDESFVLFLFLCEEEKRCSDESVFVEERCEFPRKREFCFGGRMGQSERVVVLRKRC